MSNKILITGAAGFIGRQLSDYLEKKNISTIDVDDLSVKPVLKPKKKLIKKKVESINAEFLKKNSINKIVHLAAKKSVDQSFINLKNSTRNFEMTLKLLDSSINANVEHFFNASTCEIFGYQKNKLKENNNFIPHSPYAVSKVANEYLCNIFLMRKPKMKITSLIFFNTFGPSEGRDAVIPKFIKLLKNNKKLNIEGSGKQSRDFTYIDDTIAALFKIINSKKYFRQINIGSGKNVTIKKLVSILRLFYPKLKVKYIKSRVNEIQAFNSNIDLLKKQYGHNNSYSFRDGVKKTIENF